MRTQHRHKVYTHCTHTTMHTTYCKEHTTQQHTLQRTHNTTKHTTQCKKLNTTQQHTLHSTAQHNTTHTQQQQQTHLHQFILLGRPGRTCRWCRPGRPSRAAVPPTVHTPTCVKREGRRKEEVSSERNDRWDRQIQ